MIFRMNSARMGDLVEYVFHLWEMGGNYLGGGSFGIEGDDQRMGGWYFF